MFKFFKSRVKRKNAKTICKFAYNANLFAGESTPNEPIWKTLFEMLIPGSYHPRNIL